MMFSIIIPTCNRNDLLAKCLDRLAPSIQTFDSNFYEVIVTDDSKGNAAKIFVEKEYNWVKWVEGPKRGPATNRNNGAKYAKADWLVFLDDDCVPGSSILLEYQNLIQKNPNISVFEGAIFTPGPSTSPLAYAPINTKGGHLWSCNFAIKKESFAIINGFDEQFKYPHMEDIDLRERLMQTGYDIVFAKDASVVHPWRNLSNGVKLGQYQEMYIYYHVKHKKSFTYLKLISNIFRVHFALLRRSILSKDIFLAIKIMFEHMIIVTLNYYKWKKKYVRKSQS